MPDRARAETSITLVILVCGAVACFFTGTKHMELHKSICCVQGCYFVTCMLHQKLIIMENLSPTKVDLKQRKLNLMNKIILLLFVCLFISCGKKSSQNIESKNPSKNENRSEQESTSSKNIEAIDEVMGLAKEIQERFDNLVVLGIGGSARGTTAIFKALCFGHNLKEKEQRGGMPRLYVLDNVDPEGFAAHLALC